MKNLMIMSVLVFGAQSSFAAVTPTTAVKANASSCDGAISTMIQNAKFLKDSEINIARATKEGKPLNKAWLQQKSAAETYIAKDRELVKQYCKSGTSAKKI